MYSILLYYRQIPRGGELQRVHRRGSIHHVRADLRQPPVRRAAAPREQLRESSFFALLSRRFFVRLGSKSSRLYFEQVLGGTEQTKLEVRSSRSNCNAVVPPAQRFVFALIRCSIPRLLLCSGRVTFCGLLQRGNGRCAAIAREQQDGSFQCLGKSAFQQTAN